MNTLEARIHMRELARDGLERVRTIVATNEITIDDRDVLRRLSVSARTVLADAGYPGEASWRALQRAAIGLDTGGPSLDLAYWQSLESDLVEAMETLDVLLGANVQRDSDIRVVG